MADQGNDQGAEKSFDASPGKIERERNSGNVLKSQELSFGVAFVVVLLGFNIIGPSVAQGVGNAAMQFWSFDRMLTGAGPIGTTGGDMIWSMIVAGVTPVLNMMLLPMVVTVLMFWGQRAIVFAPKRIQPKLSKVSILKNAKGKYGPSGLFEFTRRALSMFGMMAIGVIYLASSWDEISYLSQSSSWHAVLVIWRVSMELLAYCAAFFLVLGVADYIGQRHMYYAKLKMTHKELRDEMKDAEGDPHFKSQRKQKAEQILSSHMQVEVAGATVVVVNPTHYAVALKWDPATMGAPICVAKGIDELALAIKNCAAENGVPIRSDPPTARALFRDVDIGHEVPSEFFGPVAAAIRFAEKLNALHKSGRAL